jgi:hypothetical protein
MDILAATMQRLALSHATFYSTGVFSPTLTIGTFSASIFHLSDAQCRASEPNLRPTPAIAFSLAIFTSQAPGWR